MLSSKDFQLKRLLKPILAIFARWKRSRLRQVIRGHRLLREKGSLGLIATIQGDLTETPLILNYSGYSSLVFGAATAEAERVVRQYLLLRIGGLSLNATLLRAVALPDKGVVYPLPAQWRSILKEHGFRLSQWRCELLWRLYVIAAWGYGNLQIFRVILGSFTSKLHAYQAKEKYVYFVGLSRANLPHDGEHVSSHNIVSWYLQWPSRNTQIKSVRHGVVDCDVMSLNGVIVRSQPELIPPLQSLGEVFRYIVWGLKASLLSLGSLLRGRWCNALMLNQAAMRAQVAMLPDEIIAAEYLFHNSAWLYRPLWTYELESKRSGCSLYFYSTNCERFKKRDGYLPPYYGYAAMNWPRYFAWDRYQAEFIRRATGDSSCVLEVGPIWFSSSATELPDAQGDYIALFDVTPFRESWFCGLGLDNLFYTPEVSRKFIGDVIEVANAAGITVLLKRKRNIGSIAHPSYRKYMDSLQDGDALRIIDPELSAFKVAKASRAVISMPFTSTAIVAKSQGVPSVYYDPCGIVERDDRAAHGIDILIGKDQLEKWVKQLISCNLEHQD